MALFEQFPYANFHELNLDWVLKIVKQMQTTVEDFVNAYATPITVQTPAEMTNANLIYVYAGETIPNFEHGHWYYYNKETNLWTDGGKYGAFDCDDALSTTSENAVQNKVITNALAGKKNTQTAKASPNPNGAEISFIDTISQNAQGVITATKKTVQNASVDVAGTVNTTMQTFAGVKSFRDGITLGNPLPTTQGGTGNAGNQEITLSAGPGITIIDSESYKWGNVVKIYAKITVNTAVSSYANIISGIPQVESHYAEPLYNLANIPVADKGIYADRGNTAIRASTSIPTGSYIISLMYLTN